jgi:hypothetical protein
MNRLVVLVGVVALVAVTLWAYWPPSSTPGVAGVQVSPGDVYNPVTAGEILPDGFRQLLPRDAIRPVYDPQFVSAGGVAWPGGTQVIGVSSGDEAKAYPVSFLNRREMVVDSINGIPILVTW